MIRVMIVEDDPDFRARFSAIVLGCPELALVDAVATCREALETLRRSRPDVLLCDLGLPDGDGADVVRSARELHADLDAMVISVFGDESHVMRSIEAGATGYLLKDSLPENIIATIKQLHEGGSPINPIIARRLLQRFSTVKDPEPNGDVRLSEREREVLQLVARGFRAAEIADELHISHHTVASHIKNIYGKLAVTSRGEAVYEASRRQLI